MFNAFLFTIVFVWLFALTVRQANFSYWLKIWQDERSEALAFMEKWKASNTSDSAAQFSGGPEQ